MNNGSITGLELSPRKIEYLKYLLNQDGSVKTNQISNHFGVDPSTITKTIIELSNEGYLKHIPYRGVQLTDKGQEYAKFLVKRHRILSLMFSHYGIDKDEACTEVARFESKVSKKVIDQICDSMGHPTISACGKISHAECNYLK
ncbi:metal-dependent transcriptional regulator [Methanosalsum natronophilum]|uniref:metal-dependent transcriptional regulator n=1 Tax=Methanosalsum natronophilum TaxID=768733 RepID=UPI002168DF1A|nr:metal-dependent transcriptional regulator [Methanosalsum natronophilum]MCS3923691.1 Mn-dependent DtxR family transcriptional regulator [Methanosalsum natronophilum]